MKNKKWSRWIIFTTVSCCLCGCFFHPLPDFNNPNDPLSDINGSSGEYSDGPLVEDQAPLQFPNTGNIKITFDQIAIGQQVGFGFVSPVSQEVFSDLAGHQGETIVSIPYTAGQDVILCLEPELFDYYFLSTHSQKCIVTETSPDIYELNWEDGDADDYNDVIMTVWCE